MDAHANPYIAGRALGEDPCFFGREDVLQLVETELRTRDRTAVVLFGQRRIGKTSILKQLEKRLSDGLVAVRFDLFEYTSTPLGRMLAGIAGKVADHLRMSAPQSDAFDDEGQYFRRTFLPAVYQALGPDRRLIMLFDEFDVLDGEVARQLTPTAGENAFFSFLRKLMEDEPRLGFVIVIGRKAEDLTLGARSAFRLGARYKRVSVLDEGSVRKLIRLAEAQGSLILGAASAERIFELTARHPYFTQLVCQHLFDRAHDRPEHQGVPAYVDVKDVDVAVQDALEAGHNVFSWIWDGLPPAERVVFAAIAAATEVHPVVTKDQILQILQEHGVRILVRELELAPEILVEWELLCETKGGYRFFVELLRRWIVQNRPMRRVMDELDSTVQQAHVLYQGGKGFFERGQWDGAEQQLRAALKENPNHVKANVLLGESLHKIGRLEEAEVQLEKEALPRDHDQARYPLVRVLLDRGGQLTKEGHLDAALAKYRRVLELSPNEKVARESSQALLTELGQRAFKQGQFEQARLCFQTAGQVDWERQALRAQAEALEAAEDFDGALLLFGELLKFASTDEERHQVLGALERCEQARGWKQTYQGGKTAYDQGDYVGALEQLIKVTHKQPNYKDAPSLVLGAAHLLALAQGQTLPPQIQRQQRRRQLLLLLLGAGLGCAVMQSSRWLANARAPADEVKVTSQQPESPRVISVDQLEPPKDSQPIAMHNRRPARNPDKHPLPPAPPDLAMPGKEDEIPQRSPALVQPPIGQPPTPDNQPAESKHPPNKPAGQHLKPEASGKSPSVSKSRPSILGE